MEDSIPIGNFPIRAFGTKDSILHLPLNFLRMAFFYGNFGGKQTWGPTSCFLWDCCVILVQYPNTFWTFMRLDSCRISIACILQSCVFFFHFRVLRILCSKEILIVSFDGKEAIIVSCEILCRRRCFFWKYIFWVW